MAFHAGKEVKKTGVLIEETRNATSYRRSDYDAGEKKFSKSRGTVPRMLCEEKKKKGRFAVKTSRTVRKGDSRGLATGGDNSRVRKWGGGSVTKKTGRVRLRKQPGCSGNDPEAEKL